MKTRTDYLVEALAWILAAAFFYAIGCALMGVRVHADTLDSIARIESSGRSQIVGDGGRALGLFQMHRAAWNDACQRLGVSWPHSSAIDPKRARTVAANHLAWLCAQFEKETGRKPNASETYALWNLGIEGFKRRNFNLNQCPAITKRAARKMVE